MSNELVIQLDDRGVLNIRMNRPQVHNAFDEHQIARLTDALKQAGANPMVKIVVLGSDGKHFCAGADINYMQRMGGNTREQNVDDAAALAALMHTLNYLPKPTIIRIQGAAYGGAVGLVCCSDIAIGATSSVFSLSEVKIGLVPATIGPYVIRAIGQRAARRLFITGERVAAHAARAMGLLHSVVEDELLDDAIDGVIESLLDNSPNAMAVAKQAVFDLTADTITDDIIERSITTIADIRESDEGREGIAAFLEKRKPGWKQD